MHYRIREELEKPSKKALRRRATKKRKKERQRIRSTEARFNVHRRARQMRQKPGKFELIVRNALLRTNEYAENQWVVWDRWIVDFFLPDRGVVIEIDGREHYTADGLARDSKRTESLLKHPDIQHVIRWKNSDVVRKLPQLLDGLRNNYPKKVRP